MRHQPVQIIEHGHGPPLVLIPGIQGRPEYLHPAIEALSRSFHVLTFPLCGERASGAGFDPARGFDNYAAQVATVLDARHIERAAICGVSFGGFAALRFAATHPQRTAAIVLVSTPPPAGRLRTRHRIYARMPWLFGPLFLAEAPFRLRRELAATFPRLDDRWRFARWQLRTLMIAPLSLSRMAERARLISTLDLVDDCRRISAPTLVVTGERHLDYIVPVDGSSEYARLIPGARTAVIERTGHLGSITRPDDFSRLVADFLFRPARGAPPSLASAAGATLERRRSCVAEAKWRTPDAAG